MCDTIDFVLPEPAMQVVGFVTMHASYAVWSSYNATPGEFDAADDDASIFA